ncbi:hypothetical protein [Azospirillum palustre]
MDAVSSAFAAVSRPVLIRLNASAVASATQQLVPTIDQLGLKFGSGELTVDERATVRLQLTEGRRQANLESIGAETVKEISECSTNIENDSAKEIDLDWMTQFANYAQDISSEKMQQVWAKVLAGQILKPGSFSLRALHTLHTMSYSEALDFQKMCRISVSNGSDAGYLFLSNAHFSIKDYIDFNNLSVLESVGLLIMDVWPSPLEVMAVDGIAELKIGGKNHYFTSPTQKKISFPSYSRFSPVARELMQLIQVDPDAGFVSGIIHHAEEFGWELLRREPV